MAPQRPRFIRASELGRYAFCARAWWLGSVMEVQPTNTAALRQGEAVHARHGRRVWLSRALVWLGVALLILAGLVYAFGSR